MNWVLEYDSGPGRLVGPFPNREAAEEWAHRYAGEYAAMGGPLTLSWHVAPVAEPDTLAWW